MQESQDEKEEHQKGEVHNEWHTRSIFDNASTNFSDDSYYTQSAYNCSAEASCLDDTFGSFNNDKLELEPCYTNMQEQRDDTTNDTFVDDASFSEWCGNFGSNEPPIRGEESEEESTFEFYPAAEKYYEVFPYNGIQSNALKFIYESPILSLQLCMKTCTPRTVHLLAHESENLFTNKMPMHRKRVRLRRNYALRCSKLLLEVNPIIAQVDIPFDPGRIVEHRSIAKWL